MTLLPPELRHALRTADIARRVLERGGEAEPDAVPLVKFFNPVGPATWLATELLPDGDTLFGLADLGFGYPELGSFSLREIEAIRLPFGLRIERDLTFESSLPLSVWAEAARRTGSLIAAEQLLGFARTVIANRKLPDPPEGGEG